MLKALSLMLAPQLAISPRCTHTKGHGGHKATVAGVQRRLPQVFADLRLATHPDKTFIGRIERGFDFLGYR